MPNYLLYVVIFATVTCAVFGIAGMFPSGVAVAQGPTLRRGASKLDRVMSGASKFVPQDKGSRSKLDVWLLQAGFASPQAAPTYYGIRIALFLALPMVTFFILPIVTTLAFNMIVLAALISSLVGFMLPAMIVGRRRTERQRQIREGLPDMLDLLLVCSEAGIGIDMALTRVSNEIAFSHPLMAKHIAQISAELLAGRTRSGAMKSFAERTGIPEVQSLVSLLVQSDALGTSMADTLRAFSEDMRSHRLLLAEEIGHKVGVKLSCILVALFLPAILAAMIAPMAVGFIAIFASVPL